MQRIRDRLASDARRLLQESLQSGTPLDDSQKFQITAAFNLLLEDAEILPPEERPQERCGDGRLRGLIRLVLEEALEGLVATPEPVIQVGNEPAWETWRRVGDFSLSGPEDPHYLADFESGEILFGNGLNGRVPGRDCQIRARFYRHSLGPAANLASDQVWLVQKTGAESLRGRNPLAAQGGSAAETVEQAKLRARREFNRRVRAVTAADYQELALSTPGLRVSRAAAVANRNPDFPGLQIPGHVTVVVIPQRRAQSLAEPASPPYPSAGFLETVQRHLDSHRLVATQVHVIPPRYRQVSVRCRVFLSRKAAAERVRKAVEDALAQFLDPLAGGMDGQGWPLSRPVFPSEVYQLIDQVEGVDYAVDVSLNGQPANQKLELGLYGLPFSGRHHLEILEFEQRRSRSGKQGCSQPGSQPA